MVDVTLPYVFAGGTKAIAKQVNSNFEEIVKGFTGFNVEFEQLKSEVVKFNNKPVRDSFDIIPSLLGKAPVGAYPLWTGEWIYNARNLFKEFWAKALEYKKANFIRVISTEDYDKEVKEYLETGAFVIDELNGHIRLPKITEFVSGIKELAELGKPLLDQMQGHAHNAGVTNGFGSGKGWWNCNSNPKTDEKIMSDIVSDGKNGDPRTGEKTYPCHVKVALYIQVANNTAEISSLNTEIIAQQLNEAITEAEKKYAELQVEFGAFAQEKLTLLNSDTTTYIGYLEAESNKQIQRVEDSGNNLVNMGTEQTSLVNTEGVRQVGLVAAEGVKQVGLVTQSGANLVATGTAQINLVTLEGNKQSQRVQDIGANLQEIGDTQVARVQTVVEEEVDKKLPEITGKVDEIIAEGNSQIQRIVLNGNEQIELARVQAIGALGSAQLAANEANRAETAANNADAQAQSIYQDKVVLNSPVIVLQDKKCRYIRNVVAGDAFSIDKSALTRTNQDITFELILRMLAVVSFNLGGITSKWMGGDAPDLSEVGEHWLAFTSQDGGLTWRGSYEGKFAL